VVEKREHVQGKGEAKEVQEEAEDGPKDEILAPLGKEPFHRQFSWLRRMRGAWPQENSGVL
jgi:hypothetical protein